MALIDQVMPAYDRRELHEHATDAPPAAVWAAVHELGGDELRLMRLLMGIRTLGRRREGSDGTVLEGFERMGFRLVAEEPGSELVVAGIGRFWKLSGGLRRVEGREHFTRFDEPGYAKVAFNFRLVGDRLSTETRIAGTDPHARRRFKLYWLLVRPGSGLIRHEWLRAIAKRARSAPGGAASAPPQSA
jgi:hypothetical protein